MRILGIDPGTRVLGYAVLDGGADGLRLVGAATIRTRRGEALPARLAALARGLRKVLADAEPDVAAVERAFLGLNAGSALALGEGRGAVLLTLAECGLEVREYTPAEVKKAVTGRGNARKERVRDLLPLFVRGLDDQTLALDASDAVAVAVCHATHAVLGSRLGGIPARGRVRRGRRR